MSCPPVLAAASSLDRNLNACGYCMSPACPGGDCRVNSPTTDLNYTTVLDLSEMEFVMPGPGARSGIRKCFADPGDYDEAPKPCEPPLRPTFAHGWDRLAQNGKRQKYCPRRLQFTIGATKNKQIEAKRCRQKTYREPISDEAGQQDC